MDRWKSVLAMTVAGALAAGPALAQTTTPTPPSKPPSAAEKPAGVSASDSMKTGDAAKTGARGKMGAAVDQEKIRKAQQALKDKGHYEGEVDGIMGPKTREAMKKFQKAEGIQETGRLDAETMAKLGLQTTGAADTSGSSASPRTEPGSTSGGTSGSSSTPSATTPPASGPGASSGGTDSSATPGAKPSTR